MINDSSVVFKCVDQLQPFFENINTNVLYRYFRRKANDNACEEFANGQIWFSGSNNNRFNNNDPLEHHYYDANSSKILTNTLSFSRASVCRRIDYYDENDAVQQLSPETIPLAANVRLKHAHEKEVRVEMNTTSILDSYENNPGPLLNCLIKHVKIKAPGTKQFCEIVS
jgi:hypothetical protein